MRWSYPPPGCEDRRVRVALAQLCAGLDTAANLDAVRRAIAVAARAGPDLVVLPEAVMHDFGDAGTALGPVAQPLDGPFVEALHALAREHATTLVAGMFERAEDPDRPYNTLVVVDADGLVASYRKVHLYDAFGYRESDRLLAGVPEPVTVDVAGVRVGLMTCYDLRFPEWSRLLVDAGADVLVVPAAWVRGPLKEDQWEVLLRARAVESTCYVAAAAQCGRAYCGRSMLVDPQGVVVAGLGEDPGVATGDVEPDRIAEVRRRNPSLANRRVGVARR
jgi:predicted amidohydrolase